MSANNKHRETTFAIIHQFTRYPLRLESDDIRPTFSASSIAKKAMWMTASSETRAEPTFWGASNR